MKGNKGFTLVEILAVIMLLGLILAVVVSNVNSVMKASTQKVIRNNIQGIIRALESRELEDPNFQVSTFNIDTLDEFQMDASNYQEITATLTGDNEYYIYMKGDGKFKDYIACGTYNDIKIVPSDNTTDCSPSLAATEENAPILAAGMTPIKWVNGVETQTTANDTEWYDYVNKLWANAKTADGSYWVWIPRFAYSITSGYNSSTTGTIDVKLLEGTTNKTIIEGNTVATTPTYSGSSQTNYIVHPAFNFGGTQIAGIWIPKFEPSDNGTGKVKIIPNVTSWRNITVSTMYNNSRGMETDTTYGWGNTGTGIDTHMMKNIEWGAVAYLSKSVYGYNNDIWINPSNPYTTGCAGNTPASATTTGCINTYETTNGQKASTTGNITGIYDMSGGAWEYVMGNIDNLAVSSGLTPSTIPDKYIDRYNSATNQGYNNSYFGDAYFEISYNPFINGTGNMFGSWNLDISDFIFADYPWTARGGGYWSNTGAGVFSFSRHNGAGMVSMTFRPVLIVGTGL